jgi:Tol biopolymer transport system component
MEGVHPATFGDIVVLPLSGNRRPRTLVATDGWDTSPTFSPDGRHFAYASEHQGGLEVFVQSYPQTSQPVQVSKGGGLEPLWSQDGKRIYYLSRNRALMEVQTASDGAAGEPTEIAPATFSEPIDLWTRSYCIGRDGRFLVLGRASGSVEAGSQIHVVVNWFEDLKRLVPAPELCSWRAPLLPL